MFLSVTALAYANLDCMQNYSLLKILTVDEHLTIFVLLHRYKFFLNSRHQISFNMSCSKILFDIKELVITERNKSMVLAHRG